MLESINLASEKPFNTLTETGDTIANMLQLAFCPLFAFFRLQITENIEEKTIDFALSAINYINL